MNSLSSLKVANIIEQKEINIAVFLKTQENAETHFVGS
jgi:hypothetical protein